MDRYTPFPDFHSSVGGEASAETTVEWNVLGSAIPLEVLVLSWATLLRSFTGEESPVFSLNRRPVRADPSTRSFHGIALDSITRRDGTHTAIITEGVQSTPLQSDRSQKDKSPPACALSITLDLTTGAGSLQAPGGITASFLDQIGRQLKQVVQSQALASGLQVFVPAAEGPELSISNPRPQILPGPQLLHHLALAEKQGSHLAIEFLRPDGTLQTLSYDLLDHLSTRLAARVAAALSPARQENAQNIVIPVLLPQSVDLYVSLLAILKAGAAFCPLSLDTPSERIDFILNDVAADVVVTQSSLADRLPSTNTVGVVLTDNLHTDEAPRVSRPRIIGPEKLAYVMYTSGSTGRPKGVGISHRAATQSLLAHDGLIAPFKRFLQFASPTFDVSVFEIFFPLFRGAVIASTDRETMLRDISSVIRKLDVDAVELTPTVAGELLRERDDVPSLKILLTIGEMLNKHVVDEFGRSSNCKGILHGMYGPTEATIHCTMASDFQVSSRVNLIGKPFKTVSAYIVSVDQTGNFPQGEPEILPVGQLGELVIGGQQLADGYINRPDENSKAFLISEFHGRLYRTGDKARLLPTGEIECFGRISGGQVKLRGQRIELGEIEHVVCMVEGVRSAVAVIVGGTLVVFALVDDDKTTADHIRQTCRQWLPRFMVPGEFVLVKKFPQLASGKVDRKSLEMEFIQQRQITLPQDGRKRFRDALEEKITICICETLSTSALNLESLIAAGLDSLMAIRLASRLRTEGINLDVGKLLEADSIGEIWHLAKDSNQRTLKEEERSQILCARQKIVDAAMKRLNSIGFMSEIDSVEPCSHIQLAMLAETARNPRAYCNWIELEFAEGIGLSLIRRQFCRVAQQTEILRSGFVETGIGDNSHSRFTWNRLNGDRFQEVQYFNYEVSLRDEDGVLSPLKVQFRQEKQRVRALIHLHHALYDGWSWELILDDLRAGLSGGAPAERPSYKHVTDFYMEFNNLESVVDSTIYWQDHLHEVPSTNWPNLNDQSNVPSGAGVAQRLLNVSMSEIEEASRKFRVSRQAIFQAAFAYLLSSYFGTSDVVFGTVFSGRTIPIEGIESIIGPCIRVVPTRMDLDKARNVADLLGAIHNSNRKALQYGNLSLQDIKKASGTDPAVNLFDSLIVWQETLWKEPKPVNLVKEVAAADFLEFAMTLELEPRDEGIHARASYQRSVLPAAQVEIFLEQVDHVVSLFIDSPDLPIDRICDSLPSSVLSIENAEFEPQLDLPKLALAVEKIASEEPDRVAIEFLHSLDVESGAVTIEAVTYYQLNVRANRLAHHLIGRGVNENDLVGVLLVKSIDLYVSILAVVKVGAGYIPITPQTPSDRMAFILTESKARFCITDSLIEHDLHTWNSLELINLDREKLERYPDGNVSSLNGGETLAYVVFTSGSTGKPKGVLITHRNLQSNIAVLTELYPVGKGTKMLQACSQAFDVSVFEIFFSWHRGMTLCSATNDIMFRDIEHVIHTMGVTHLSLTPTVAALVDPKKVPNVRFLVTAGEGMTAKVHKDWGGKGLYQGYGPSETTNICTVRPNLEASDSVRNIGRPLKNTSAFVISDDKSFSLVPRGAIGEFCFGGDQVGRGYLNMPVLTNEKFIEHPHYGRLYRSGDFGRLLADGSLVFTGRRDDQVKLRGQRIELGEINGVLLQDEAVKDCASIIVESETQNQQQLITFWRPAVPINRVNNEGQYRTIIMRLFEELNSALPSYMVPSSLIPIDSIPMTTSKKIDNRRLRQLFWSKSLEELRSFSVEAEPAGNDNSFSDVENCVATLLAEITCVPLQSIHRNASFYYIGLDSVSAIALSRKLRDAGFGQVDVSVILRHSSVARLSKIISNRDWETGTTHSLSTLGRVFEEQFMEQLTSEYQELGKSIQAVIPCTPLQEAMLSQTVSNNDTAYFNHLLFRVHGNIDNLREAWNKMVSRHDILRTCFATTNDARFTYAQIVMKDVTLPWSRVETTTDLLPLAIEEQKIGFTNESHNPFALPYSFTTFDIKTTGRKLLLLSIHHALHDGEAMSQLLQEVELAYSGKPLPDVISFDKFIGYMVTTEPDVSKEFWRQYLSDLSPRLICSSANNGDHPGSSGHRQSHIDLDIPFDTFERQCKEISVTPLNVFHTAWARLLAFHTSSVDVCFGNVFSCRTIPLDGVERIVGPCFNTLPLRIKLPSNATNADVLKMTQKSNVDILPHQLSSLRSIQKSVLGNGLRFFDTLIILQKKARALDSGLWQLIEEGGEMDFPIICEVTPYQVENKVHICLHSKLSQISQSDAEIIMQNFVALVRHTIRYPSARAADQSIVGSQVSLLAVTSEESKVGPAINISSELHPVSGSESYSWRAEESEVRHVLSSLSGIHSELIKPSTTIFQLGLDSINAVQISATLKKSGYEVSVSDILETPAVSEIASLLTRLPVSSLKEDPFDFVSFETRHRGSICEYLGIRDETVQSVRPCTAVQSGMLALFSNSGGDIYFNRMTLRSFIPLDKKLLKEAWSKIVARHEMLRTGFVQLQDQQYPFAMITYREGTTDLPWYESLGSSAGTETPMGPKDILRSLHRPPWFLKVETSELNTLLEFSALHAIYDAQSLELIFRDVTAAYKDERLPDVVSNNSVLGHILAASISESDRAERFWKDIGQGVQSVKFPDLNPVCAERGQWAVTSKKSSRSLKLLDGGCRDLSITLQAAGQAAWARLLSAYTGETNIVFGLVLSGRDLSESAQEAVMPCLVTVPSPCQIQGTNRDLVSHIMKLNASLVKNKYTPLSKIQRWLNSEQGLFDTLFVYQKLSSRRGDSQPWEVVEEDAKIDYPVSIEMIPSSGVLELRLTYRTDVIPHGQATLILEQFDSLLIDSIFSPDSSSDDYSGSGCSLLSITPAKEEKIPSPVRFLHEFVEESARKVPSKVAFEFATNVTEEGVEKRVWSYDALNVEGNRMARFLQRLEAYPGDLIAICFDKCPEASLAILAVLKAGCAYVALDPNAPIARKQFIVKDSGARLLLCTSDRKGELETIPGIRVVALDESGIMEGVSSEAIVLDRPITPDDTCYCLYTSGTTGTPKGCEITHENAVQAMLAFQRLFDGHWDEESRWLQFASFHFDVSVLEQYWSWSVGICVTSCPRDLLFEDLPGTIQRLQITHIDLTPSLARLVHPNDVPSLCRGVFITGGEQLKQEILDAWGKHGVIYNGYGPTEVTIGCTMLPRVPANGKPSNIGPQFDNVGSYVFKPGTATPVLRGSVGELCVSGALVGRCYLNRPDLTKEKFQFLEEFKERVYRTGDMVRSLCDGSFQFLGRIDDQVKLRGQRLEIGEINEVIKGATSNLGEVTTLVVKHPKQSKEQLISFVTRNNPDPQRSIVEAGFSKDDHEFLSTVKNACRTHLPSYMVPTHIIPIISLPLSPNNKVEVKALKEIYQMMSLEELQMLNSMSMESQNADQDVLKKVTAVLAEFVDSAKTDISPQSSIYELGLDSISVISFARSLREAGFSQAQPSSIMKNPTVSRIAMDLQDSRNNSVSMESLYREAKQNIIAFSHKHLHSVAGRLRLTPSAIEGIAPCTPLQQGMIYHFLESDKPLYCSSFSFKLLIPIDSMRLKSAWAMAQDAVQLLRARFSPTPDGYAQVVLKDSQVPWFEMTASNEEHTERLRYQKFVSWCNSMDDFSGSLWEVGLVKSPTKWLMCLNIFHALYDGNSLPLLLEKVAHNYLERESVSGELSFLETLPMGPLCRVPDAKLFWTKHLAGISAENIFTSTQREGRFSVTAKLDIDDIDTLEMLRRLFNVTEQAVLHACWLLVLHRLFAIVPTLGIVVSGRTSAVPGIEDSIGPLFNTIPSNIKFQQLKTWSDLVQRCYDYHISTLPFQHTPLRDIMKWTGRTPDQPLFQSLFVFQKKNTVTPLAAQELWMPLDSESDLEYPLAFEAQRNDNGSLTVTVVAQNQVMSSETAQALVYEFRETLLQLIQNPSKELPVTNCVASSPHMEYNPSMTTGEMYEDARRDRQVSHFEWTREAGQIRDVIAQIAGISPESIREWTSIFELGLDSIDAIKLSSRLNTLNISLSVSAIMRRRTVGEMAAQLIQPANGTVPSPTTSLARYESAITESLKKEGEFPKDIIRVLPATPIQEAMVAEMVASDYTHYYNHDILELEPEVGLKRLQNAWNQVFKTHPILRTSFIEVTEPGIPFSYAQLIHEDRGLDFPVIELEEQPVNAMLEDWRVMEDAGSPKSRRPLMAIHVVISGKRRYMVLSIAHALYDGWSLGLLHDDVSKCYAGHSCERPSYEGVLEQIIDSSGEQSFEFWRTTLANFSPTQFPRGPHAGGREAMVHRQERALPITPDEVNSFCKCHGITMQALFVTCWTLVLAGYVERLDVVFGLVVSGRNIANAEQVMFPTMNTVAMRSILHGTRCEMLKYTQGILVDMAPYQHFPLRKAKANIGSRALFDSLFIYQKKTTEPRDPQKPLYRSICASSNLEYPICVEVESTNGSLTWRVACRDTVLGASDTTKLLERIGTVLHLILQDPDQPILDFADNGLSICGSPAFQEHSTTKHVANGDGPKSPVREELSPFETKIREVLAAVSNTPEREITKETTLFHLGLDSISAIKVSSLLKKQFITLPVSDMLKAGTIQQMARVVKVGHGLSRSEDVSPALVNLLRGVDTATLLRSYGIQSQHVDQVFPATAGQIYLLAMNKLNPSLFYSKFYYKIEGLMDKSQLDNAWSQLMLHIPMLRTAFVPTPQRHVPYIQVVLSNTQNPIVWHSSLCHQATWNNSSRSITSAPVALHACQRTDGTFIMLQIHHALYDAVSLPKMMDIFAGFCNGQDFGGDSNVDLAELVAFQGTQSPLEMRRQFWKSYLEQSTDKISRPHMVSCVALERFYRPALVSDVSKLEKVAKRHAVSIQALFLAAYARIYPRTIRRAGGLGLDSGSEPGYIIIGLYLANRGHALEGLPELIAPTLNIVPLKIKDVAASESLFSVARRIQADLQEISRVEFSGVSLVEIADWTGVRVDTCVNFLSLPESGQATEKDLKQHVKVIPTSPEEIEELSGQSEGSNEHGHGTLTAGDQTQRRSIERNGDPSTSEHFADVFKPSIDVEAAIRDNALDVGIFGPKDRVDKTTAEAMLANLRQQMQSIAEEAEKC